MSIGLLYSGSMPSQGVTSRGLSRCEFYFQRKGKMGGYKQCHFNFYQFSIILHPFFLQHTDCYCLEAIPKTLTSTTASSTSPTLTTTYSTDLKTDSQWSTGKVFKTRSSNMHSSIPKTKELAHAGGFPEVLIVATTTAATLSTLMVNGSLTTFDNGTLTRHHAHLDVGSTSLTALWIVVILLVSVCFVVVGF